MENDEELNEKLDSYLSRPKSWPGSENTRERNWVSHNWATEEGRCFTCEARMFGIAAEWPCGSDVPRENVPVKGTTAFAEAFVRSAASAIVGETMYGGNIEVMHSAVVEDSDSE